jgi:NADPH:quinone reductase
MKAVFVTEFGSPEVLKCIATEIPTPGPKQVLIRVIATSINFADVKSRYGKKGSRFHFCLVWMRQV